jgi:hypothetical protein
MELISHICERDISNSKIEEQFRFENLASKQKTFRIVKEQQRPQRITVQKVQLLKALKRQELVEPTGIEPVTSCLQSRRSPS